MARELTDCAYIDGVTFDRTQAAAVQTFSPSQGRNLVSSPNFHRTNNIQYKKLKSYDLINKDMMHDGSRRIQNCTAGLPRRCYIRVNRTYWLECRANFACVLVFCDRSEQESQIFVFRDREFHIYKKVKQSLSRPGQTQRVPGS